MTQTTESAAYIVVRGTLNPNGTMPPTDGFTGEDNYVQFHRGAGVLDQLALRTHRPDWFERDYEVSELTFVQKVGVPTVEDYAQSFRDRGWIVAPIAESEATNFRRAADAAGVAARDAEFMRNRGEDRPELSTHDGDALGIAGTAVARLRTNSRA